MPYEKIGKNEPVCIADEVPFDIPESWEWVRLGNLFQHNTGKALNASNHEGTLLQYITTSNLYWNRFELASLKKMYFTDAEISKCTVTNGDLLVCEGGDIGRAAIWRYDYDICIQNHIHRLRSYIPLCTEFFYYLFYLYKNAGWIGGKGIGIQGLSSNAIHVLLFPLPPLNEQKRIVEKLQELKPFTSKYDFASDRINTLNSAFPEKLKKSILQESVQGKLVPQDPADEPASALLERIRAEKEQLIKSGKIKRDKHESVIFRRDNSYYERVDGIERCIDDEIPFEISESWEWVRLNSISKILNGDRGKNYPSKSTLSSTGIPFISALNLDGNTVVQDENLLCMTEEQYNRLGNGKLIKNDIVVCIRGSLGKHGRYPFEKGAIASSLTILRPYYLAESIGDYIMLWLDSPAFFEQIRKYDNGTAQPNLAAKSFEQFLIPLPPHSEQHRIIAKVEMFFSKLKTL